MYMGLDVLFPNPQDFPSETKVVEPLTSAATTPVVVNPVLDAVSLASTAQAQTNGANQAAQSTPTAPSSDSPLNWDSLKKKQDEIAQKEQALKALEAELDKRVQRLDELEGQLKDAVDKASVAKNQKLRHLIDVYSNMKAKQAAQVLQDLDEDIAVQILAGMRGRQAGEILTYVEAKKAAKLSEKLTEFQAFTPGK